MNLTKNWQKTENHRKVTVDLAVDKEGLLQITDDLSQQAHAVLENKDVYFYQAKHLNYRKLY